MLELADFSGGLNARDGYDEVTPSELRDGTLNWTLDERSAITVRKGCPAATDFPTLPANPTLVFYSYILNLMVTQVGNKLYGCAPGGGSWTLLVTFTTTATCAICEWGSAIVYTHPVDGTLYYNGTINILADATVKGSCIAVWQNKVWVGSASDSKLWWSSLGTVAFNPGVDVQALAEKDNRPVTALFGGPTLVAFKEGSHYRINDSTTGSYTTVDWNAGAVGSRAVVGGVAPAASGLIQEGGIFFWGLDGLYAGDGLRPAILVGDKLHPRFTDSSKINATTKPQIAGGVANGRIYFAFPKTSTTQPDTILEYHPRDKWLLEHSVGSAKPVAFTTYATSSRQATLFADAAGTKLIELMSSATRTDYDGSAVAATLKTGFATIRKGLLVRLRKATFTVTAVSSSAVTFAASYIDASLGSEQSTGLTWGARTLPVGTSETTWNGSGRAPAFSFALTCSGVAVTLRRILVSFYPVQS